MKTWGFMKESTALRTSINRKNARKKDERDWTAVKTNTRKLGDELSCQSQKTVRAINVIQILQ